MTQVTCRKHYAHGHVANRQCHPDLLARRLWPPERSAARPAAIDSGFISPV